MRTRTKIISGLVAAVAAAGALTLTPWASASTTGTPGMRCYGDEVRRCIKTGTASRNMWGYASIDDADGGRDYSVSVTNLVLYRKYNGKWSRAAHNRDNDGWATVAETVQSDLYYCSGMQIRVKALFKWKRAGSSKVSKQWIWGPTRHCAS